MRYFFKQKFFASVCVGIIFAQCTVADKKSALQDTKSFRGISSVSCSSKHNGAVVVMYHRFDGRYSDTSVTKTMLENHIQFFMSNGFRIVPLKNVVDTLKRGGSFSGKNLAITVDDAYKSVYEVAHPLFVKHRIPYTVFVNTEGIDKSLKDYMTWDQLRHISKSGLADLEAHGHAHAYMIRKFNSAQRAKDVKQSVIRIYRETGRLPRYFAYPYGETHKQFINELKAYNWSIDGKAFRFLAAFTTQSGPVGCSSSLFALPRFALNMKYGQINKLFRYKMNSRHLPLQQFTPDDLAFCSSDKKQKFILRSYPGVSLNGLNCFATNGKSLVKVISPNQAEINLQNPFIKGLRQRINCTLPAGGGRFFWLGKEFAILQCKK